MEWRPSNEVGRVKPAGYATRGEAAVLNGFALGTILRLAPADVNRAVATRESGNSGDCDNT